MTNGLEPSLYSGLQQVVALTVDRLMDAFVGNAQRVGTAEPGWEDTDTWHQLYQWLLIRDDPALCQQLFTAWLAYYPPDVMVTQAIREAYRLELLLARKGDWQGRAADLTDAEGAALEDFLFAQDEGRRRVEQYFNVQAISAAQRANSQVERWLARPAPLLTRPLGPVGETAWGPPDAPAPTGPRA